MTNHMEGGGTFQKIRVEIRGRHIDVTLESVREDAREYPRYE